MAEDLSIEFDDLDEFDNMPLQILGNKNEPKYIEEKKTLPVMTMYEKVNVISARVKQLNSGYKSTIEDIVEKENLVKSYDIAIREFQMGKLPPYHIKRVLPNGNYELWSHEEFSIYPD